jgi:hypothetical protein
MANSNGWGDGAANNAIGWGQGANNAIGWGDIHADSWAGLTDIVGITTDPDAQAFITAAAITDPTQQTAINTLVVDLKGYNVWSKMKALYPFVGGTASQHSYNLRNTSQFQITWNGGVTHSTNGVQYNGTNSYGNTNFNCDTNTTILNNCVGAYSRTNVLGNSSWGAMSSLNYRGLFLSIKGTDNNSYYSANDYIVTGSGNFVSDTRGFYIVNRESLSSKRLYKNGTSLTSSNPNTVDSTFNGNLFLGARNINNTSVDAYDNKQYVFQFMADTLTATEIGNLHTAVQAFQTTLGRSIGTQTVSDADAQAFVTAANIVDQVEANAINNLVIGLKADGLWTKMKAIYPFVGGTAATHKFNLKNPLDTDAAFRLFFGGGWTHSSTGATPGVNGYADSFCKTVTNINVNSHSFGIYSRINDTTGTQAYGVFEGAGFDNTIQNFISNGSFIDGASSNILSYTANPTTSLIMLTRRSQTDWQAYRAGISLGTRTTGCSFLTGKNFYFSARNQGDNFTAAFYCKQQLAFGFIGDGLTNTESGNFYTAVQAFQTALSRNI